ncbi:MAG: HAD family phosphatase [Erysipelotrichaceae bacterium]|nr:HAD family phosphatase [Erysipelotrichaceae bacterium]
MDQENNKLPIKLIAMDMDGTLLNSNHVISEQTLQALIEAEKKGVRLVLSSGRSYKSLTAFGEQLQMPQYDGYFIGANGAAITKTATMEHEVIRRLNSDEIHEIYTAAFPYDIEIMGVMDDTIYDYIPTSVKQLKEVYRKENNIAEDVPWTAGAFGLVIDQRKGYSHINYIEGPQDIPCPINKICFAHEPERLDVPYQELCKRLGKKYHLARTTYRWIECQPLGINKGNALLKLAKELGISPDEIAVFGDGENDLSMFEVVKYPVAMANAMESVKAAAFEVTLDNDSDGIAHFLKKYQII